MNNSKQLTQEQLTNPVVSEKIRKLAEPIIWHMQTKEAYNLALNLEKSLESADLKSIEPKLAQEYQDLINKLKLTALPMLNDEEVVEIINKHFLDGLQANLEMENRLTAKLFSLPLMPRDEFRQQLQKAIRNNKQRIGPWSIEQWLVDYNNFTAPEKRTNISPREYLIQNRQVDALAEEDKNKLYTLFHIYDHLLLVTPVVSEEELGQIIGPALRPPAPRKAIPPATRPIPPVSPGPPSGQPAPTLPAQSIPPRPSQPLPPESVRPAPTGRDIYQEPIEESPRPTQVEPKIKGNIVDLKNQ